MGVQPWTVSHATAKNLHCYLKRGFITAVLSAGLWNGTSLAKQRVKQKERRHSHLQEEASMSRWKRFQVMRQLEAKPTYRSLVDKWLAFGFALFDAEAHEAKEIVQLLQASMFSTTLQQETH